MSRSVHTLRTPSLEPNMGWLLPQSGQVNMDMLLTRPRMGTSTFLNMLIPFTASLTDRVCGVVTITEPRWGCQ